ncbi:MAG TPA: threonine synthase [Myxococcaceae bacterium]|nr:threonine synthase [Myxococcaceae bacterium]
MAESSPRTSRYVCSEGCDFSTALDAILYRCPKCSGLLNVRHDRAALSARSGPQWRALFAERYGAVRGVSASGVWGKKEWVLPDLAERHIVSLGEGRSPLQPMSRLAAELGLSELHLKQCGITATGSFKDLGMTVLVSQVGGMRAAGIGIRAVLCASTGDTSAALAAYCAAAGIPAVVVLPRAKVSVSQLVQPIANGAHVLSLATDFDGCMRIVQELSRDPHLYLANSMNSLRLEGQKTVAMEIVQQLDWEPPDWIVIPGGNLGNVTALGMGLELMRDTGVSGRLPRIAVAQAERANPLYRSYLGGFRDLEAVRAQPTLASAIQIGNPVSIGRAVRVLRAFDGVVEQASEDQLANAAARADRHGAFADPHTGVALAAVEKLCAAGIIARGSRVVVVSTAHGLKFPDFKVGYHERRLPDVESLHANPAVELPPDAGAVRDTLDRLLDRSERFR